MKAGEEIRTPDVQLGKLETYLVSDDKQKTCKNNIPAPTSRLPQSVLKDPNLSAIIQAWPSLPEAIKAGILAMVKASGQDK